MELYQRFILCSRHFGCPAIYNCFLLITSLIALISAPFEFAKYKKSDYCKTYKDKYFVGITTSDKYKICSKLLENGIAMQQVNKSHMGYWCLTDEKHLIAIFSGPFHIHQNNNDRENPIIEDSGYGDTLTHLTKFIAEEELHYLDKNKCKQFAFFIRTKKVDPELKYILNNNGVFTYSNVNELVKLILVKVQSK